MPSAVTADTIVCPYNDIDAVAEAVAALRRRARGDHRRAGRGEHGRRPAGDGFLEALRQLCDASGALLVFDEVITGFRVARGGAQERYGVTPDLTILGKIVGGGLPLAAFGGRADVMEQLAPSGPVYQAGTLSGNPLATAAGISVLRRLRDPSGVRRARAQGRAARGRPRGARARARVGAMLTLFMTDRGVRNFEDAQACDTERYGALFRHLLDRGIYVAPVASSRRCSSRSRTRDEDIDRTVEAAGELGRDG